MAIIGPRQVRIILGSYRHKTSITFILAEIIVQIHSMADTNIKIQTK
jgi:hypothetical protein